MKVISKLGTAAVAFVAICGFVACTSTTSGNTSIAQKSEFELKESVIVGKTTKRQVYEMLGEPTKNFGVVSGSGYYGDYKISNPKTTNLVRYDYNEKESGGVKNYIPVVSSYMSKDSSVKQKAFYVGFDDNDIVTERWYFTQSSQTSETNIDQNSLPQIKINPNPKKW